MKQLIIISIVFLFSTTIYSQKLNDKIVTLNNDTINCDIGLINDVNIFYATGKSRKGAHISIKNVLTYNKSGEWKTPKPNDSNNNVNIENESTIIITNEKTFKTALSQSGFNFTIGASFIIIGGASSFIIGSDDPELLTNIAVGSSILGAVFILIGSLKLMKASEILKSNNNLSLGVSPRGLLICYRF